MLARDWTCTCQTLWLIGGLPTPAAWFRLDVLVVQRRRAVRPGSGPPSASCSAVCSSSACWVSRWAWGFFEMRDCSSNSFFVGGLEFFLLHLQSFVELQLGPRPALPASAGDSARLHGGADTAISSSSSTSRSSSGQPSSTTRVDAVVIAGGYHQYCLRAAPFFQSRADLEAIHRHIVQANQAIALGGLPSTMPSSL